jgi:sterol desaturase/sphingolipid hydroxylase (fatty acid hydroxylase superfamily)
MVIKIILTIISACFVAEFCGYFVHVLLHSHKIEFLSRTHMIHHLHIYGPKMHQRPSENYINSTKGRAALGQIGLEWLAPIGTITVIILLVSWALNISLLYESIFIFVSLGWGYFMFSYVHDTLHMKGVWLEKNTFLRNRFNKARRLHDIHHMELNDDGFMTKNFGICFFFFDRLFGSLSSSARPFNKKGFDAAGKLYSFIGTNKN